MAQTNSAMKNLKIFVSYSHDDGRIATALSNLLQLAFGPALTEVFLDKTSISFGANIKATVTDALRNADVLIAVSAGAQPASALSWPGFEIGMFSGYWDNEHYKQGPHKDREKRGVMGQVVVLSNEKIPLGPEEGQRPVNLGISEDRLSGGESEEELNKSRTAAVVENSELLEFLQDIEELVKDEADYVQFQNDRDKTLPDLVRNFKFQVFDVLRNRVRSRSKPTKQLIVRTKGRGSALTDETKIISVAGASEIFGKSEGDPRLFKKIDDGFPGSERYEAAWGQFKTSVKDHRYGAYWCGVIEQAVIGSTAIGAELDSNLVLISNREQRYRIIAATVTTYFNNDSEVSLYLIEALQRRQGGDAETSNLLNCITIILRFRFAFLEGTSPFYWRNFGSSAVVGPRDLLMELDYLKGEATNANLEKPGAWEDFMSNEQLTEMMRVWNEVDIELRKACCAAIAQRNDVPATAELTEKIVIQLKKMFDEVKPFNTFLGIAITQQLLTIFQRDTTKPVHT